MPYNGETNQTFGIYKSICCGAEIVINAGVAFPDCPNHRNLSTIWKAVIEEKVSRQTTKNPHAAAFGETHIENRRIFEFAAGTLKPAPWEQEHLHECNVCQGVLYVFISQPINGSSANSGKPSDAA